MHPLSQKSRLLFCIRVDQHWIQVWIGQNVVVVGKVEIGNIVLIVPISLR